MPKKQKEMLYPYNQLASMVENGATWCGVPVSQYYFKDKQEL